jgi:hypothetical protein
MSHIQKYSMGIGISSGLTLILLTWRIWWTPNNASKWQMGFNSAFKGLKWLKFESGQLPPLIQTSYLRPHRVVFWPRINLAFTNLTFIGPCIVILIIKANEMHYFSNLFDKVFYMFRTGPLSIIRTISTLYTQQQVFVMSVLLASSRQNAHNYTFLAQTVNKKTRFSTKREKKNWSTQLFCL